MIDITHIHPMLVHFPIVLFLTTVVIQLIVIIRKGDLASRNCLPLISLAAIWIGVGMAILAAFFGDIALDAAVDKGFDKAPLEEHEGLAGFTIVIFSLIALIHGYSVWRRKVLTGARAGALLIASVVGVGVLISTAYHGGNLVYEVGVNVTPVKPVKNQ